MAVCFIILATVVKAVEDLAFTCSIVVVISWVIVSFTASEAIQSAAVTFENTFIFGVAVTSDISRKALVSAVRVVFIYQGVNIVSSQLEIMVLIENLGEEGDTVVSISLVFPKFCDV